MPEGTWNPLPGGEGPPGPGWVAVSNQLPTPSGSDGSRGRRASHPSEEGISQQQESYPFRKTDQGQNLHGTTNLLTDAGGRAFGIRQSAALFPKLSSG